METIEAITKLKKYVYDRFEETKVKESEIVEYLDMNI